MSRGFLDRRPNSLRAHRILAKGLLQARHLVESAQALEMALQKAPQFLEAYVDLAVLFHLAGRTDAAGNYLERARTIDPTNVWLQKVEREISAHLAQSSSR